MLNVNLFDAEFSHTLNQLGYITCSDTVKPKKINWHYRLPSYEGITIFTDRFCNHPIVDSFKFKTKIFWIFEPPAIRDYIYRSIKTNFNKFDYVLTYDENLLKLDSRFLPYVVGQCRVEAKDQMIYQKSKMLSMIASNKTSTIGHQLRHKVALLFGSKYNIDLFGTGYNSFDSKLTPLKDYMFSISIMNSQMNNFFTEVLIDLFKTGTVPIFWGASNIDQYFNTDGMIIFNTIDELENILNNLTTEDYDNRLEAIQDNFERASKYLSTDDYIADILESL